MAISTTSSIILIFLLWCSVPCIYFVLFRNNNRATTNNSVLYDEKKNMNDRVTFYLYDNGASKGAITVSLFRHEFPTNKHTSSSTGRQFAMKMSQNYLNVSKFGKQPGTVIATKAFREDGEQIQSFEQLLPTHTTTSKGEESSLSSSPQPLQLQRRKIYLVAHGMEFIYPFVKLGHNQTISSNVLPPILPNKSIILESISDRPRVFKVYNLFTSLESILLRNHILTLQGHRGLSRSTVGERKQSDTRTSDNAWDSESPIAKKLISRSFNLTRILENDGQRDGLQIVRYQPSQAYNIHPDFFEQTSLDETTSNKDFNFHPYTGGSNRFATVFLYLNDVEEGGCTIFPKATATQQQQQQPSVVRELPEDALGMFPENRWEYQLMQDCYDPSQLTISPQIGTALLFYSITPHGKIDRSSVHGACPVVRGTKWGANIWIWNKQRYGEIRTGEKRTLTIVYEMPHTTTTTTNNNQNVTIFWEGKPEGELAPGQTATIYTYEYHRFQAAKYNTFVTMDKNHNEKKQTEKVFVDEFTIQSEPYHQTWSIQIMEQDDDEIIKYNPNGKGDDEL